MPAEVKQRALEAQLYYEATINHNYLTFNHTRQDPKSGSCI